MGQNLATSSHYCAHNIFGADYATASVQRGSLTNVGRVSEVL
jgi:hypothetical protein